MRRIGIFQTVRVLFFATMGWAFIATATARAADMSFSLQRVTFGSGMLASPMDVVVADGGITPATPLLFQIFLGTDRVQSGTLMLMNSGGGDLDGGLELGRAIRKAGLNTEVGEPNADGSIGAGTCASACTFMFLGGILRSTALGSQFGVHRFARSSQPDDLQFAQQESAKLIAYVKEMGVSTSMIERMAEQGPADITWLTPDDMKTLGVTSSHHTDYNYVGQAGSANLVVTTTDGAAVDGQMAFSCTPQGVVARVAFPEQGTATQWNPQALSWSTEDNSFTITSAPSAQSQFYKSDQNYNLIDSFVPPNVLSAAVAGGAWIGANTVDDTFRDSVDLDDFGRAQLGLIVRACGAN